MTFNKFPKSDRRVINVLFGVIAILAIITSVNHKSKDTIFPAKDNIVTSKRNVPKDFDSIRELKKRAEEKRKLRYQEIKDSFARLNELRAIQKGKRLAKYLALKDSFYQLKEERKKKNDERKALWEHRQDSLRKIYPRKLQEGETIELNHADSIQLKKIPGIGRGYSIAILQYRNRLGGFHKKEQVLEIEGRPPSILNYLEVQGDVQKIEVNKLSVNQLRKHPYINFYQAKAIWDYRQKYGKIKDINQLALLNEFQPEDIERLSPYIAY